MTTANKLNKKDALLNLLDARRKGTKAPAQVTFPKLHETPGVYRIEFEGQLVGFITKHGATGWNVVRATDKGRSIIERVKTIAEARAKATEIFSK